MALDPSLATDQEAGSAPPERFATNLPGRIRSKDAGGRSSSHTKRTASAPRYGFTSPYMRTYSTSFPSRQMPRT
jgi:hypothetical protein